MADTVPTAINARPQLTSGDPRPNAQILKRPYTPAVMSTADIKAEMLLGAAGCASGSQMCNGMAPAFTPNPKKKSAKIPSRIGPDVTTSPDSSAANESEPAADASVRNAAMRQPVPTC